MRYVKDIMTKEVKSAHTGQNLSDVSKLLREGSFHHVPILDNDKPVGLITSTDLYKLIFDIDNTDQRMLDAILDSQYTIEGVMTKEIKTIEQTARIREAADMLSTGSMHSLLVVDDKGAMLGILTSTDLIRHLSEAL